MKLKVFTIGLLASFSLVACQAEQETGQEEGNGNNNGVENTQFERTTDQDNNEANMNKQGDNDRGMQHNTNYDVADKAAERISKDVKNVENAYVLKTRNNAYVAAELNNQNGDAEDVSGEVEDQITKIVKDTDQDIDNVYISTNPDFVDLTNNYVNDVDEGEPVQGFFREFGEMVDRVFPDANA